MIDYDALARLVYAHAEQHYGDKDARWDVIVECMKISEIADILRAAVDTETLALAWGAECAGAHFEAELNQAWDGPESVRSSSKYDPRYEPYLDPAVPLDTPSLDDSFHRGEMDVD